MDLNLLLDFNQLVVVRTLTCDEVNIKTNQTQTIAKNLNYCDYVRHTKYHH